MSTMGMKYIFGIYSVVFSSLFGFFRETKAQEQTTNMFDPLASFYIRQEAALRKLDALIVKVGQIDSLEAQLSAVTQLLEDQQEKNQMLEDRLNAMEAKTEDLIGEVRQVNTSLSVVSSSICQVEEHLINASYGRSEECQCLVGSLRNVTEESHQTMLDYTANLTLASEMALEEMKAFAEEVVVNVTWSSLQQVVNESSLMLKSEVQTRLSNLEDLVASNANVTRHLFSATFSRIRVSNLAMDKRLAALLHTSSTRQRVLQDSLLTALTSVAALVKSQTQDVIRKTESRLGSLEISLASSAKRHAKELATLVLETANLSLYDVSSSTLTQLENLLQIHLNQSAVLEDTLELLKDFKNQTVKLDTEEQSDVCLLMVGNQTENGTLEYTGRSIKHLEKLIYSMQLDLGQQVAAIGEQLMGMRIYYSTSLHMNTDQVVSAIENVQTDLNQALQENLAKSALHLEKLRRSSLGLLDAAVTSITSSAVASAQSTADQLKESLNSLENHIGDRLDKLQSAIGFLILVCPLKYTRVGNTCLFAFPDARTSWHTARDLCQQEEGDLAIITDSDMLGHLKAFLYITHAKDTNPPPPYWVGARKSEGLWLWMNGSTVDLEVGDASKTEEEEEEELETGDGVLQTDDEECLMSWGAGIELVPGSCESLRAVLCQHKSGHLPYLSPQQQHHHHPLPEIFPQTTARTPPYVVIDPVHNNDLISDGSEYIAYLFP